MKTTIYSLDGNENVQGILARPDRYRHLHELIEEGQKQIARGAGLSYANAGGGEGVTSISTSRFNRILNFEPEKKLVTVEPGLTINELFQFLRKHGFYVPVIPGYPGITIGGCVGFNVHGKSQYRYGNFIEFVESFKLYYPQHDELICSRDKQADLFYLTVGGFGLTGFIKEVTLRIIELPGKSVMRKRKAFANLKEAGGIFETYRDNSDLLYAWSDLNKRGKNFGCGILYTEKFSNDAIKSAQLETGELSGERKGLNWYNRFSSSLISRLYHIKEKQAGDRLIDLSTAFFPLGGSELYFSLFGKQGLLEYSVIISPDSWERFCDDLEKTIRKSGIAMPLTTLRLFKGERKLLYYCDSGIGINIDAPACKSAYQFFSDLDQLTLKYNGTINLSKDSRISVPTVKEIFPEYDKFRAQLNEFDPESRFDSALRKRIDV